jgi:hypothetical protein
LGSGFVVLWFPNLNPNLNPHQVFDAGLVYASTDVGLTLIVPVAITGGLTIFDSGMLVSGGLTIHSGALKVSVKIRVRVRVRVRGLTIYSGTLKVSIEIRVRVRVRCGVRVRVNCF